VFFDCWPYNGDINKQKVNSIFMMSRNENFGDLVTTLFWSLFIGVVGISIGLGAIYPPLNLIAKPFVCASGHLAYQKTITQATPTQTFFSASWTCTQADLSSKLVNPSLFAGTIYGLVCFPISLFLKQHEAAKKRDSAQRR
jgi:hypothetical protein